MKNNIDKENSLEKKIDFDAINLEKYDERLLYERAGIFYLMKRYKDALLDYKAFVNLAPHMKEGYLGMADCYCQMNQMNNAIEYYNKSIEGFL